MKASKKPEKIIFNPEYFFTRVDLLKHLKFPKSSTHVLIIPSNSQALGFRPNSIPDRYLTYKLDRSLLENSIVNANQIFEAVWKKKRLSEQNDELLWLDYLLYIAFFLIGLLLLCLLEFAQGKEGGYEFIKAGIGIFIGIFIIIVVVIGVNCFRKPRVIKFEETVYKKLKEYFDKENETVYKDINMVWVVQERCFWLELYLDRDFIRHF